MLSVRNLIKSQSELLVKDMMTKNLITISPDDTMLDSKIIMKKKNISGIPVVEKDGTLVGIVSIVDVILALDEVALDSKVGERMSKKVISLNENQEVSVALDYFRKFRYGRLPVVDDENKAIGIITPNDIVSRLINFLDLDKVSDSKEASDCNSEEEIYLDIKGGDFTHAGGASSQLKKILEKMSCSKDVIRRAAIASYEAEMNVVIHSNGGFFNALILPDKIIIRVHDYGPGIEDISLALKKGYSTATDNIRSMGFGAGMGLPNIKRFSDKFRIVSSSAGTKLDIEITSREGK